MKLNIKAPKLYQKFHQKEVMVRSIDYREGELYSITVEYEKAIPRVITYYNNPEKDFSLTVGEEITFEGLEELLNQIKN